MGRPLDPQLRDMRPAVPRRALSRSGLPCVPPDRPTKQPKKQKDATMTRRKARTSIPVDTPHGAAELLEPFCDPDKSELESVFHVDVGGNTYVAGSDGARMHLLRWHGPRFCDRDDAPSFGEYVERMAAEPLGELGATRLTSWVRLLPSRWYLESELSAGDTVRVAALRQCGGEHILECNVDLGASLEATAKSRGFDLRLLADAVKFCETASVSLWGHPRDSLTPGFVTPYGVRPCEAERFAVVMPIRL